MLANDSDARRPLDVLNWALGSRWIVIDGMVPMLSARASVTPRAATTGA